jgi:hypothetical protein
MIGGVELDDMVADVMHRGGERPQHGREDMFQDLAARLLLRRLDVGNIEVHDDVDVAHVEGKRIFECGLLDLSDRFRAIETSFDVSHGPFLERRSRAEH